MTLYPCIISKKEKEKKKMFRYLHRWNKKQYEHRCMNHVINWRIKRNGQQHNNNNQQKKWKKENNLQETKEHPIWKARSSTQLLCLNKIKMFANFKRIPALIAFRLDRNYPMNTHTHTYICESNEIRIVSQIIAKARNAATTITKKK